MTTLNDILTFNPIYKTVLWGGSRIASLKGEGDTSLNIGESWEISVIPGHESTVNHGPLSGIALPQLCITHGEELLGSRVIERFGRRFPLLLKFIDARDVLSLQVHPEGFNPAHTTPGNGKSELWYVIDCNDDSIIYSGLAAHLDPETFATHVKEGSILDLVACHTSRPGQFYYIPSGTIHAIGAGNLIAEVQESSDTTYRIYDFDRRGADGRPRELHTDLARRVINYNFPNNIIPTAATFDHSTTAVVDSPQFVTDYLQLDDSSSHILSATPGSFTILMIVEGSATISVNDKPHHHLTKCHTALIPACISEISISGPAKALVIHL